MDSARIRKQFAGLESDWTFFDNAGGSQVLRAVVRRIASYFEDCNVQHGASYAPSREAVARVAEAREGMAAWINAPDPADVVIGPSTTQLLRNLADSLGRTIRPGDEIVVTDCDHEANIGAWLGLERFGARIRTWSVDPDTLELDLEELGRLMNHRTRLVAWTHVSNVLGRIHPVRRFADFVRERGALSCVDGVAFAPHRVIDVQELGVDFYVLSFYKVFGPHLAMLFGRHEVLLELPGINHFFIGEDDLPYKLQPGNANFELSAGLMGLWDYVGEVASWLGAGADRSDSLPAVFEAFTDHETALAGRLLDFLGSREGVRIVGPGTADPAERVCTVSFVVDGRRSGEIVRAVDEARIGIRYGDFYARRLIDRLGLGPQEGVVRVSLLHYNTFDEVDRLIDVLDRNL